MSAARLRAAADRLDELAGAATPGPWRVEQDEDGLEVYVVGVRDIAQVYEWSSGLSNPAYIAAMHPEVGRVLAAWLRAEVDKWQQVYDDTQCPSAGVDQPPAINYGNPRAAELAADWHTRHALALANLILGGSDD